MSTDADRRIRKRILFGAGKQHLISKIIAVAAGEKLGMRGKGWKKRGDQALRRHALFLASGLMGPIHS